jgi:hypothetical protein
MTMFGTDGNGDASIALVTKTGSDRAKVDLLHSPALHVAAA